MNPDYEKILQEMFDVDAVEGIEGDCWVEQTQETRDQHLADYVPVLEKHFREFESRVRLDWTGSKLEVLCAKIDEKYTESLDMLAKMQTKKGRAGVQTTRAKSSPLAKALKEGAVKASIAHNAIDPCPQCTETEKCNYCARNSEE